jgi:hypothetical protein
MMGTPANSADNSQLRMIIENPVEVPNITFRTSFLDLTNNRTGLPPDYYTKIDSTMDYIQFDASYSCRNMTNDDNAIESYPVSKSRNLTGGEHTVRATKWVIVNEAVCGNPKQDRAVLVEVLLWRD